ncbi:hypothetical protein HanPSC8_Chr17g0751811 [Helianthus annuus]|uniref:Uncharacterized protein n=1 Tax=Helianthus annuus TaxID=4232 RepID=A0A251VJH2_HELAN|nr:hypothetical protein HanPSC8_Chr17g0751811 [Helianthus annuus]
MILVVVFFHVIPYIRYNNLNPTIRQATEIFISEPSLSSIVFSDVKSFFQTPSPTRNY